MNDPSRVDEGARGMGDAHDEHWAEAVEGHRKVVALYALFEQRGIRFRAIREVAKSFQLPPGHRRGVDTDRVFCALACKAATTKDGIFTLAERGDGDSALALLRVLVESAILLKWFLGGEGRKRLETYVLFTSVSHEQTVQMIKRVIARRPDLGTATAESDPFNQAIAESVFGGNDKSWAYFPDPKNPNKLNRVGLHQMFKDVTNSDDDDALNFGLMYMEIIRSIQPRSASGTFCKCFGTGRRSG